MFWPDESEAGRWARQALAHATVAVGNRDEVAVAVGTRDPRAAPGALLELGVEVAIVKQGPAGVLVRTADGVVEVPPVPIEVVNGLGAGDAFGGALVYGLLQGWELERAVRLANAAGAYVRLQARVRRRHADHSTQLAEVPRMRLTVAQALVRFLAAQRRRARRRAAPFFAAASASSATATSPASGQALKQHADLLPYHQARNEQAMVHVAAGYARQRNRLRRRSPARRRSARARRTWSPARRWRRSTACPCCCCPATRSPPARRTRCSSSSRRPHDATLSVNDCLRPVSRYFERVERPEQLCPPRWRRCACSPTRPRRAR